MVLTACFVLSPVRPGFVVTVRATLEASSRPRQCVNALRGRHLHRGARTTRLRRPRYRHSSRETSRPSHPASNVRDDREAPLLRQQDGREDRCDLPDDATAGACDRLARRAIFAWRACETIRRHFAPFSPASLRGATEGAQKCDCPSCQCAAWRRALPCRANQNDDPRVSLPQEGRFAIVTDVGSGMRWTQRVVRRTT